MLNKDFKDRSAKDRVPKDRVSKDRVASEAHALAELLAARELRDFSFIRQCEIGPFVVECLFAEQALIVELAPSGARQKFLTDMGYSVLAINPHELALQPRQVLRRLCAALREKPV